MTSSHARPILGALAVVYRRFQGQDQVILVQRKNEPKAGFWGFPGGHVELGETALEAAARELLEETGVQARPFEYLTNVDVLMRDACGRVERQYLLTAVLCEYIEGNPSPQDDAQQAEWVTISSLTSEAELVLDRVYDVALLARARWRALNP